MVCFHYRCEYMHATAAFYCYINDTEYVYIHFSYFCLLWFCSSFSYFLSVVRSFVRFIFNVCMYVIWTFPILWESDKRLRVVIYNIIFAIFIKLSNWHQKSKIMMNRGILDDDFLSPSLSTQNVTHHVRMQLLRFQWWE